MQRELEKILTDDKTAPVSPDLARKIAELTGAAHTPGAHELYVSHSALVCQAVLDERPVAVKLTVAWRMWPGRIAAFHAEIDALTRLAGHGVPLLLRHGQGEADADGTLVLYFVMPWYPKCFLDVLMASVPPTPALAWGVVRQIAATYTYAHSLGITHNDLKPENVYLDDDGAVVVGDWNTCCDDARRVHMAKSTQLFGTVQYNPRSGSLVTTDADAYRFGALMYVILYRRPLTYDTKGAVKFPSKPGIINDADWKTLCTRLLDRDVDAIVDAERVAAAKLKRASV